MKLLIARHGEASFNAASDKARPLTPNGKAITARLVDTHFEALRAVQRIWNSELVRARETASIFAEKLHVAAEPKDFLTPDDKAEDVLAALQSLPTDETLLIVSHQPLIGDLVSVLCTGSVYDSHPFITSEIVVLEYASPARGFASLVADFLPG